MKRGITRWSEKVERVTANTSPQIKDAAVGMGSDPMRQLMEQLSVMLQQNNTKNSRMAANLILNYPTNWILDSGATDHIIGNKKIN
jgi:hypothetical protein